MKRGRSNVTNASTAKTATAIFSPVVVSGSVNAVTTAATCRAFSRLNGRSFQVTFIRMSGSFISRRLHAGCAIQMPSSLRALAFSTFGLISSRMSSLAKSASQRSGVITGQSEPNSILSCRIELM